MFAKSILKFSSKLPSAAVSLLVFYVALLLCDVDALEGGLFVVVLYVQTFSGMLIYQRVSRTRLSLSAEFLGMGFAIGSFLSMVGDQLSLNSRFSAVGWLFPLGLGLSLNFNMRRSEERSETKNQHILLWALAGAFVSLGIEWFWTFPIGLSFAVLLYFFEISPTSEIIKNTKIVKGGAVAIVLSATFAMLWTRPKIWWMQHWYDYYQFENWSSGLAHFGTNGVSGFNYEFKYHWFSFAWNGLLARLSNAQPWVATTRASVLIGAVVIQIFFIAIVEYYGHKGIRARIMSVILAMFTTVTIWNRDSFHVLHLESFSLVFSLIWLLAVYLLLLRLRSSFSVGCAILVLVMSVASIGGKSSFGLLAACAVFALATEVLVNERKRCMRYFVLGAVNLVLLIACARLWLVDSDMPKIYLPTIGFINFLGDMSSENLIFRKYQTFFLAGAWFSGVFLIHFVSSLIFLKEMFSKIRKIYLLEILVLFASVVSVSVITFFAASQIYIAYGSFVLLLPLVGSELLSRIDDKNLVRFCIEHYRRAFVAILFIFSLIFASSFWPFRSIDVNSPLKVFLRQLPYLGTLLVFVSTYLLFRRFRESISYRLRGLLSSLVIVALGISSVTFYLAEWSSEIKQSYERMEREEDLNSRLQFGLAEEHQVADWVNRFTSRESVIASNYMFSECAECVGNFRPVNSRLPIEVEIFEGLVHRRLLIRQQNLHNAGKDVVNSPRINDLRSKKQAISYFTNTADYSSLLELQQYGVNFLVVSLDDTSRRDWGDSVKVVFKSSKFFVLDFSSINS